MRITEDDPNFDSYTIALNGREMIAAVAADSEEGWVDIIDPILMGLSIATKGPDGKDVVSEEFTSSSPMSSSPLKVNLKDVPYKRLYGTVIISR